MSLFFSLTITITIFLIFSLTLTPLVSPYGIIVKHTGPRCTNDSQDVNSCIHRYMEKDYPVLSMIMYPHKPDSNDSDTCQQRKGLKAHSMIDGPILESTCRQLYWIYDCLESELPKCDQLNAFFNLRHLLYSLRKILRWLCGVPGYSPTDDTHQEVRSRFKVLLESAECLECLRISPNSPCRLPGKGNMVSDPHLWLKILRLQIGPEVCHELGMQLECMDQHEISLNCETKAKNAHHNITSLFMKTYCDQHPLRQNSNIQEPSSLLFILCLLSLLSSTI